jgi:hypothetical protein
MKKELVIITTGAQFLSVETNTRRAIVRDVALLANPDGLAARFSPGDIFAADSYDKESHSITVRYPTGYWHPNENAIFAAVTVPVTARKIPEIFTVWQDADGNQYAAEQVEPGRLIFAVHFAQRQAFGHSLQAAAALDSTQIEGGIKSAVDYALRNYYFDKAALSWFEGRELHKAASEQKPNPERTLSHAIAYPDRVTIDADTRAAIIATLAPRCRHETRAKLDRRLRNPDSLKNYGIFDRLTIFPTVSYCAGQDYPSELATLRKLIIEG